MPQSKESKIYNHPNVINEVSINASLLVIILNQKIVTGEENQVLHSIYEEA